MCKIVIPVQFDQTSLGLPTRDYYLLQSNQIYVDAYKSYMIKIAVILGATLEKAKKQAEEIVEFETALAKVSKIIQVLTFQF